jgi:hypothetical protein
MVEANAEISRLGNTGGAGSFRAQEGGIGFHKLQVGAAFGW